MLVVDLDMSLDLVCHAQELENSPRVVANSQSSPNLSQLCGLLVNGNIEAGLFQKGYGRCQTSGSPARDGNAQPRCSRCLCRDDHIGIITAELDVERSLWFKFCHISVLNRFKMCSCYEAFGIWGACRASSYGSFSACSWNHEAISEEVPIIAQDPAQLPDLSGEVTQMCISTSASRAMATLLIMAWAASHWSISVASAAYVHHDLKTWWCGQDIAARRLIFDESMGASQSERALLALPKLTEPSHCHC